ncbi:MAG: cell division protein FtsL [Psychrobacillus psychrotolerans]
MALRKQQSQTYIPRPSYTEQPHVKKQAKKRNNLISKGEKILLVGLLAIVTALSVMIIQTESSVRATTTDIALMEKEIDSTIKNNTDLSVQVNELSTYDRIWKKAEELGLKLNEQNVKVVPGQ